MAEDQTGGVVIGTLGATDAQGGAMTYSIVNDPDSKFEIVGNQLRVRAGATFNYENDTAHDVRIRVTDSGGLTYEETFTINVSNVNEKPTDIGLSGTSVSSTAGGGTAIGNLTFTDPDAGATGTFTILNDPSGYFQVVVINGNPQLQVRDGATLAAGTYAVTLRVTDQGGLTYDKQFTINVVNGNVDPKIVGASDPLVKTTSDRADIQAFKNLTIQDSGTLRVVVSMDNASKGKFSGDGGIYDKDAGTFTIEGSAQFVTAALQALRFDARDKATGSAAEVTNFTITVTDSEGAVASNSNISVSATAPDAPPANRAPTGLAPSNVTLQELTKNGTPIATLSASDADGDKLTYKIILANGVAADTDGYFTVSGNQLLVANGVMFDAEQALLRQVTIEVSDGRGGVARQTFTFNISDKSPETMVASDASPFNDIIKGSKTGKFKDTFYGGAGDDKLWGGYGNDTLWGGSGKDTFVFDAKLGTAKTDRSVNFDTIKDYSVKDDSIWLENSLFKGNKTLYAKIKKGTENKPVKLDKKFFTIGDKAKEKDDYFVYDSKKRVLYYDADGSGSKEAIELATFTKNKYLKNFQYSELFFI
ncbi:Ca2+-binding RTX toxin-like protein [Microvirga flocculans]|uniref:Ca2+-binding RTX toxin-like protein n=2 Tax=Microvirga flocculans TaxID=217168 RepID=A0A7W6IHA7_9HYPH|nr:Ca2+-binding RTX toxin-like protein [Microvirga flocculans]